MSELKKNVVMFVHLFIRLIQFLAKLMCWLDLTAEWMRCALIFWLFFYYCLKCRQDQWTWTSFVRGKMLYAAKCFKTLLTCLVHVIDSFINGRKSYKTVVNELKILIVTWRLWCCASWSFIAKCNGQKNYYTSILRHLHKTIRRKRSCL